VISGALPTASSINAKQLDAFVSLPAVTRGRTPQPQDADPKNSWRVLDLVTGAARVGVQISALVASEMTSRTVNLARLILPAVAEGPLEAIDRQVARRQEEARRNQQQRLDDMTGAAESVLNRVVVEIVDLLDMEQLIDHVPINRVVARVDLPAVVDEIDLSGIIREGTKGLGGETLDSARSGLMAMDQWSAGFVDRILRRREPRDLSTSWNRTEP